jgi:hypothetical protein
MVENRFLFNSFKAWVQKNSPEQVNASAVDAKHNVETNIVAFTPDQDINCFLCKEALKIEKDGVGNQLSSNEADENCYFVDAKKIRVSLKNKVSGQVEKKEVAVHVDCLKQLEDLK